MTRMLKTAEPTMVPTPTSPLVMKTPDGGLERRRELREDLHLTVFSYFFGSGADKMCKRSKFGVCD